MGNPERSKGWIVIAGRIVFPVFSALWIIGANAQAVRFDSTASTVSAQCSSGKQCPIQALPGTTVNFCSGQYAGVVNTSGTAVTWVSGQVFSTSWTGQISINGVSFQIRSVNSTTSITLASSAGALTGVTYSSLSACLASPATTYTDFSGGTPCSTTAQLTPQTGGACLSTADLEGDFGAWLLPGQYSYYLRVPASAGGGTYGPYPVNVGASAGCPLGVTCDANFLTLSAACTAAGTGTLYLTRTWSALTTQAFACNIYALANGIIKPASGQVITLSKSFDGTDTQHFDYSSGGTAVFSGTVPAFRPRWFGAVCDASTDDRVAIQALFDSLTINGSGSTAVFPPTLCGVSPPYVYLSPNAASVTLTGLGNIPSGAYSAGKGGGGLVAVGSTSTAPMLNILAGSVKIKNMYFDCAAKAGNAIQHTLNNSGLVSTATTRNCTSDNMTVFPDGTPPMTVVSGGGIGSTSTTFDSVSPKGVTVAAPGICTAGIIFGYGTANREDKTITSGSGVNPVTFTPALTHVQTSARCHGNDDFLKILDYRDLISGGWGLRIIASNDENGIVALYRQSDNATSGGDLWESGSNGTDFFGGFEGGSGPAIQLGITSAASGPAFGHFGNFSDIEMLNSLYNAVVAVCTSGSNTILFPTYAGLQFATSSSASPLPNSCAAWPSGTSDVGWGTNNTDGQFMIKTAAGGFQFDRANNTGLSFLDTAGAIQASLSKSSIAASGLESVQDATLGTNFQFAVSDKTQRAYKTELGISHDGTFGWMQCIVEGGAKLPCKLNPAGGAIIVSSSGISSLGSAGKNTVSTAWNYISSETGTNNHLVVSLNDNLGTAVPLVEDLQIIVYTAHTLQIGANDITFNGVTKDIRSALNYSNTIGSSVVSASTLIFIYNNGVWQLQGR